MKDAWGFFLDISVIMDLSGDHMVTPGKLCSLPGGGGVVKHFALRISPSLTDLLPFGLSFSQYYSLFVHSFNSSLLPHLLTEFWQLIPILKLSFLLPIKVLYFSQGSCAVK
jgi:hypothetical protein